MIFAIGMQEEEEDNQGCIESDLIRAVTVISSIQYLAKQDQSLKTARKEIKLPLIGEVTNGWLANGGVNATIGSEHLSLVSML